MNALHSMAGMRRPSITAGRSSVVLNGVGVLALAAALTSAGIWAMHVTAPSVDVPAYSKAVATVAAHDMRKTSGNADGLMRLFGASGPAGGAREIEGVKLQGIVSSGDGKGWAVFSVDGAPSIRVRDGGRVRDGVVLIELRRRHVLLEQGGQTVELALPARIPPQAGGASPLQSSMASSAQASSNVAGAAAPAASAGQPANGMHDASEAAPAGR
jgi:hypothetical protein